MRKLIALSLLALFLLSTQALAIERAPRISDKEIIEGLAEIRGDIKELRVEIKRLEEGQQNMLREMDQFLLLFNF